MEIRMNEVVLAGRMASDPKALPDGTVHFLLDAGAEKPFQCFCREKTAENLLKFCSRGDEFSVEGKLAWVSFAGQPKPELLIEVKFISYGRKLTTLR